MDNNTLVNKMVNTLDWDMILMGLTGSPLEPHNGKNVWNSYGSLHLFNQRLEKTSYDDRYDFEKQLDYIFDEASLKTNFNERKALYDQYQQIVYDNKLIIYLYSPVRIIAIRKKFKNSSSNIVLIFSICYSIIITILSSFSVIYVGGNMPLLQMNSYLSNIFMGSGIFTTLIISFIYSYIILKIGYTLSDFE